MPVYRACGLCGHKPNCSISPPHFFSSSFSSLTTFVRLACYSVLENCHLNPKCHLRPKVSRDGGPTPWASKGSPRLLAILSSLWLSSHLWCFDFYNLSCPQTVTQIIMELWNTYKITNKNSQTPTYFLPVCIRDWRNVYHESSWNEPSPMRQ